MPVYMLFNFDVADPKAYSSYVSMVGPMLIGFGAQILVVDGAVRPLEGTPKAMTVVLKFDSEEQAMKFYNSEEYAPLKKMRLGATANNVGILAHTFVMPVQAA